MKYLSIFILFSIISGCNPKIYPSKEKCLYGSSLLNNPFMDLPRYTSTRFGSPMFNPNNNNEIIFYEQENPHLNAWKKLIKYNLKSKNKTILTDSVRLYFPNWNNRNYTLYVAPKWQMFKVNTNTLEKVKLGMGYIGYLNWTNKDEMITGTGYVLSESGDTIKRLLSSNEQNLLYIDNSLNWSTDNLVAIGRNQVIIINSKTQQILYKSEKGKRCQGISWMPNSKEIVWVDSSKGIYITNIKTGESLLLRKNCSNRIYRLPSVSPNGKYIVCERDDIDIQKNTIVTNICMMKINGKDEQILKLK